MDVNRKKRGRPGKSENKLEGSWIVNTAKSLILSDNKVPSIRKLATELDVDPMAIYHYFPNKQAVLEAVTVSLVNEIYRPERDRSWKENILKLSESYLKLLIKYPGLLKIILSVSIEGPASVFQHRFDTALAELELNMEQKKTVLDLLVDYLHGFAFASSCNNSDNSIDIALCEAPLNFIFNALDQSH